MVEPIAPPASQTIAERLAVLPSPKGYRPKPVPLYQPNESSNRVFLAVETFKRHMTNEGWQLQIGMEQKGYELWGRYFPGQRNERDVPTILKTANPGTVIVQDQREWDASRSGCFDKTIEFERPTCLRDRPDIFKLTICKDAHQDPYYHCEAHGSIGCHAWITYYHPDIVCHLSPWIRKEHVVRTYHSVDSVSLPPISSTRAGCVLSGATIQRAYPLRTRLRKATALLHQTVYLRHPGYHARRSHTPVYLANLGRHKVSICTASIFGYALRKIIESTAMGCVVITDLPSDEVMPEIDGNLVRIRPDTPVREISRLIARICENYDFEKQQEWAQKAREFYDYQRLCGQLANDIERMRKNYGDI